jgi:FAD/FMN-containing dehydrogenase
MRDAGDAAAALPRHASLIARGNGRSYGDAALNSAAVLDTRLCDRILSFDPENGLISCEAGLLLADLLAFAVPRGFFPPVTPGTKFVTIGGMVAADVHGKNHHGAGSFARHIECFDLLCADGKTRRCSPVENADLFHATCGGMGLTGVILTVTFRMISIETADIRQETLRAANLAEAMAIFEESAGWTYTVAWIDCLARGAALGRALVYRGEHVTAAERPASRLAAPSRRGKRVPFDFPGWALNRWTVSAFNALYYRRGKPGTQFVDYDSYFYPLDSILDCCGSFLAFLKLFGPAGDGFLSFPMEGYTLALDFPANTKSFNLILTLDAIVAAYGGRLYLAKDARSTPEMLREGYKTLDRFRFVRRKADPKGKFASLLSQRLDL